jgi:hypothetical protein
MPIHSEGYTVPLAYGVTSEDNNRTYEAERRKGVPAPKSKYEI